MMDIWAFLALPFVLRLTRVSAFIAAAPILGSPAVPAVVKVGLAMLLAVFFNIVFPINLGLDIPPLMAGLMVVGEVIVGLALALVARLVYMAVQQGGMILAQQMGLSDAEAIDPVSGEQNESIASFLETVFAILFLAGGGFQLLISVLARSQSAFPTGGMPDVPMLTRAIVTSGSAMLLLGLKLAAPAWRPSWSWPSCWPSSPASCRT